MKLQFTLLLFLLCIPSFSQILIQDSLVNSIAYFMKDESATYKINYEFNDIQKKDTLRKILRSSEIKFQVADSTATHYIIDWTYMPHENADNQKQPLHFQYKTDEYGIFQEWLNVKEVIDELKKGNFPEHIYLEKRQIEVLLLAPTNENSYEMIIPLIQSVLLRDIISFHNFYGASYPINQPTWGTIPIENPITKKMMDSHIYVTVDEIFEEDDVYIISSKSTTDKQHLKEMFTKDFKLLKETDNVFVNENYITQVVHASGWPITIETFAEIILGEHSSIRYTTMELINEE